MKRSGFSSAVLISLTYALFGGLWIFSSDRVLFFLVQDPRRLTQLQTYKGWAFVATSTLLIFVLLVIEVKRRWKVEETREEVGRMKKSFH